MVPETLSSGFSLSYCWPRRKSLTTIIQKTNTARDSTILAPFHQGLRPLLPGLARSTLSFQRCSIFIIMSVSHKNTIRGDCLNRGSWLSSQIYCKTIWELWKMSFTVKLSCFKKKKKKASCTLNYPSVTDHKIPIVFHVIYSSQEMLNTSSRLLVPSQEFSDFYGMGDWGWFWPYGVLPGRIHVTIEDCLSEHWLYWLLQNNMWDFMVIKFNGAPSFRILNN